MLVGYLPMSPCERKEMKRKKGQIEFVALPVKEDRARESDK